MIGAFDLILLAFFVACITLTWIGSRHFGLLGLIAAHYLVLVGYFVLAGLSIYVERYDYDGIISMIGLLMQAFLLNCLLLPVGIAGMLRWRYRVRFNSNK